MRKTLESFGELCENLRKIRCKLLKLSQYNNFHVIITIKLVRNLHKIKFLKPNNSLDWHLKTRKNSRQYKTTKLLISFFFLLLVTGMLEDTINFYGHLSILNFSSPNDNVLVRQFCGALKYFPDGKMIEKIIKFISLSLSLLSTIDRWQLPILYRSDEGNSGNNFSISFWWILFGP